MVQVSCRERTSINKDLARTDAGPSPSNLQVVQGDPAIDWEKTVPCEGNEHPEPGTVVARISRSEVGIGSTGSSVYFYGGTLELVVENRGKVDVCLRHFNGLSVRVRSLETGDCSLVYDLGGGDHFLKGKWLGVAVRVRKETATIFKFDVEKMWRLIDSPPVPDVAKNYPAPARSGKYEISFRFLLKGFRLPNRSTPIPETWGESPGVRVVVAST